MMASPKHTANRWLHLLFWLVIAAVWFYLRYQDYASLAQALAVTTIKVVDLAIVIYVVNLLLVPKFLYRKTYLLFALLFVGLVAVSSFIKMLALSVVLGESLNGIDIKDAVYNNFVTQFFFSTGEYRY